VNLLIPEYDVVYHSFEEVPTDEQMPPDGDDSIHAADGGAGMAAMIARPPLVLGAPPVRQKKKAAVVPFPRVLRYQKPLRNIMRGRDVMAVDRALRKAKVYKPRKVAGKPVPPRYAFGQGMREHVRMFQKRHRALKDDGIYGPATHAKLAPFFDRYGLKLMLKQKEDLDETPMERAQREFVAAAMLLYNLRDRVHYTQGSARMYIVRHQLDQVSELDDYRSIWEDCSSSFTGLCYVAGVPDPNGFGYNGLGYTGTLAQNGRRVSLREATIGAAALYGRWPPYKHVTGKVSATRWFSFGSEAGPYILDVWYRDDLNHCRVYRGLS
jgi:hypothetical protein